MSVRPWSETIPEAKAVLGGAGYALVIEHIEAERDHYRQALEAARDALADPNALAEDIDSPANMAFAIVNHALAAGELSRKRRDAER